MANEKIITLDTLNDFKSNLETESQTISGNKTLTGTTDTSSGILKVNVLQAKTSSSATTYGPGTSSQVLKSNGTNCYWGSDSSDNSSQTIGGNYKWKDQMAGYQIGIADNDNMLVPMVSGASGTASTGTSKTMNTTSFNPFGLIVYTSSSSYRAAGALCSSSTFTAYSSLDLRYAFNCGSTLTANAPVYIVASIQSDGQAKLASPYYTQSLPSSDDGKIYIYLGQAISTTNINLQEHHPVYQYTNGAIRLYIRNDFGSNAFNSTPIPTSYVSSVNGATGAITNVAKTNVNNNFSTTQTMVGSDDTPLNLQATHATMSNIAFFNTSGTRLGNIGCNNTTPYFWAGSGGTSGQIALTSDIPTETTVSGWGFTKNAGTITGVSVNGTSVATSGVAALTNIAKTNASNSFTASQTITHYLKVNDDNADDDDAPRPTNDFIDPDVFFYGTGITLFDTETNDLFQYSYPAKSGTFAMTSDIPTSINGLSGGELTSPLTINGGDGATAHKIILGTTGQITDTGTATLFGRTNATTLLVGHSSHTLNLRGSGTRPTYNGSNLALYNDLPTSYVSSVNGSTGAVSIGDTTGLGYLTSAPTSNNTTGKLKIVVLSSEPSTKYTGYLYIITG